MTPGLRSMTNSLRHLCLTAVLLLAAASVSADPVQDYVDHYLQTFPTKATAAGYYALDGELEQLDSAKRAQWIAYNQAAARAVAAALKAQPDSDQRIDLELLARQIAQEQLEWEDQDRPQRDPLFWTEPLAQATLYLLLRRDRPASERLDLAVKRTVAIPRLVNDALAALASTDPALVIPARATEATARLRALAQFYRTGLPAADGASLSQRRKLARAGANAARAIERLATRSEALASQARADFRLGADYERRFHLLTAIDTPVADVLTAARRELVATRAEAAAYGRGLWPTWFDQQPAPLDDAAVLRQLFARLEAKRPASTKELVAQYSADADAAFTFAQAQDLVTLPLPRTLVIGTAPAWLGGQSIGGVYAAGPFQPEAETLFLLPNIADDAPEASKARFFSAFNTGFNRMITAHELVPGHYVQLKTAARQAHPVRSLFGDGVYTEGWGSFSERLMLDAGWGGPFERLAHYKKQLENIARLIADIEVHTGGWDQARLATFLHDEALLDAQFAANMWQRAVLTSPQLTSYHLGYRDIHALWLRWRQNHADEPARAFVDPMLSLGAVPVREYQTLLEGAPR